MRFSGFWKTAFSFPHLIDTLFSNLVKVYYCRSFCIHIWFLKIFLGVSDAFNRKKAFSSTFLEVFLRNFQCLKACIQNPLFFHCPKCITQKDEKTCKKVLTGCTGRGIIYKSSRYGNKTKAKIVRHEPWKLNINLEKSECAGRAFYNARPSQITSF